MKYNLTPNLSVEDDDEYVAELINKIEANYPLHLTPEIKKMIGY